VRKTVAAFGDGDIVTELLRDFRIDSSVLCRSVMAAPWGFGVAGRERGSFHMLLVGRGWLEVEGRAEPVCVGTGDLVLLPTGAAHRVKDSPGTSAPSLTSILAHHDMIDGELRFGGDDGPLTEIVCGVFTLEGARSTPWIERLPEVIVSRSEPDSSGWRNAVAAALRGEARAPTKGGALVVNRLLESLLADTLRTELAISIDGGTPRVHAFADRRIGRVLSRLHERPGDQWTVESLAREAAMSRSAFSERFHSLVGEAPMKYVGELRLAQAARLFRSTDASVEQIAAQVGYGSGESLSRAFKLRYGAPPSAFRRRSRMLASDAEPAQL
jgi:AraC-like DNA-binding protein